MKAAFEDWRERLRHVNSFKKELLKEGHIFKKGEQSYSGWKKRYLRLWNTQLLEYFTDESLSEQKGSIDLSTLSRGCIMSSKNKCRLKGEEADFGLSIITKGRSWELCCFSSAERRDWIERLKEAISSQHPADARLYETHGRYWTKWPYAGEHHAYGTRKAAIEAKYIFRVWFRRVVSEALAKMEGICLENEEKHSDNDTDIISEQSIVSGFDFSAESATEALQSTVPLATSTFHSPRESRKRGMALPFVTGTAKPGAEPSKAVSPLVRPSEVVSLLEASGQPSPFGKRRLSSLDYEYDSFVSAFERVVVRYASVVTLDDFHLIAQIGFGHSSQTLLARDIIDGGRLYAIQVTPKLSFFVPDENEAVVESQQSTDVFGQRYTLTVKESESSIVSDSAVSALAARHSSDDIGTSAVADSGSHHSDDVSSETAIGKGLAVSSPTTSPLYSPRFAALLTRESVTSAVVTEMVGGYRMTATRLTRVPSATPTTPSFTAAVIGRFFEGGSIDQFQLGGTTTSPKATDTSLSTSSTGISTTTMAAPMSKWPGKVEDSKKKKLHTTTVDPFVRALRCQRQRRVLQLVSTRGGVASDYSAKNGVCRMHYAFQDDLNLYTVSDYLEGGNLYHQLLLRGKLQRAQCITPVPRTLYTVCSIADAVRSSEEEAGKSGRGKLSYSHVLLPPMGVLTEEECMYIVAQLVLVLDSFHHECGVIYRSLKLDHILLDADGYIVLTDFKDAKEIGVAPRVSTRGGRSRVSLMTTSLSTMLFPSASRRVVDGTTTTTEVVSSTGSSSAGDSRLLPVTCSTASSGFGSVEMERLGKEESGSAEFDEFLTVDSSTTSSKSKLKTVAASTGSVTAAAETQRPRTNSNVAALDEYCAPEIVAGEEYSYATDWWSLGCVMHNLLHGTPPFSAVSKKQMYANIAKGEFSLLVTLSPQCQDLLKKLLCVEPQRRLNTSVDVLRHAFFKPVNWSKLRAHKLDLPFKPLCQLHNELDVSNFDTIYTQTDPLWFSTEIVRNYHSCLTQSKAKPVGGEPFVRFEDMFKDPEMAWDYPM